MDIIDKKILRILAENSETNATEIGKAVNLSVPAVNKRIAKMKENKTINSFTVTTNAKAVGKPVVAFIFLVMQYGDGVETLLRHIKSDVDILECYAVTGEYDYVIKICAPTVEALEDKLLHLKKQKGVIKSLTMLSLMEHKFTTAILPDME